MKTIYDMTLPELSDQLRLFQMRVRELKRLIKKKSSQPQNDERSIQYQSEIITTVSAVPMPMPEHTFERVASTNGCE